MLQFLSLGEFSLFYTAPKHFNNVASHCSALDPDHKESEVVRALCNCPMLDSITPMMSWRNTPIGTPRRTPLPTPLQVGDRCLNNIDYKEMFRLRGYCHLKPLPDQHQERLPEAHQLRHGGVRAMTSGRRQEAPCTRRLRR